MKNVKYDKEKHKEEKKKKEQQDIESADRANFFERMNKNRKFQKYIIDEILNDTIQKAESLKEDMATMIKCPAEEAQRLMIAKSASLKTAQSIKNKIVNS